MARPCQQVELTQNLKEYSNCKEIFQKNDIDYEVDNDDPTSISICNPSFGYESNIRNYFIILFLIQYLLPILVLCVKFFMIN